jgi:glycosyltransferase involved in cell wall biosynthesis
MSTPARAATGAHPSLRVLLSAYACEPRRGSEPGVGWHWAIGLAQAGHEVWAITRSNNRPAIEAALTLQPCPGLHFEYYDLPAWARWWKRGGRGVRLYYVLWQWGAYRLAQRLCRRVRFDVVHHVTFAIYRQPSFMAFLGVPFVFGPLGGGDTAARPLRRTFPLRGIVADFARDLAIWAARIDPLMAAIYRRSAAVLCTTPQTMLRVPSRFRHKCLVQTAIGTDAEAVATARRPARRTAFRVLYVGRLIYLKGLHLGLMAFARFRHAHPEAHLTVIGSGPDAGWLYELARDLRLQGAVTWIPWMDRAAVMRTYPRHDAFLFPSLRDSSGDVVLEALSCGLPVVCLDAGGPAVLVDASCGFRVSPRDPPHAVADLAAALDALANDPRLVRAMGEAALRRAREEFSWQRKVSRMERLYRDVCAGSAAQPRRLSSEALR